MRSISLLAIALLAGCATTLDPNYALQLEAYRLNVTAQQNVEVARARAEEARFSAMASIAEHADPQSRQMALLALALIRGTGGEGGARPTPVVLPGIPESQEDRALKWAAIFASPAVSLVHGYYGYRLAAAQSRDAASSTIASYSALGTTAAAGMSANQNIAIAGFSATRDVAGSGFTAARDVANMGFLASRGLADSLLTQPRPNITLNGTGVIGAGSYTGPNSGASSGNAGTIGNGNGNDRQNPVTCTGGATGTTGAGGAAGC